MKLFMGIDPGKNGGIVILTEEAAIFEAFVMPEDPEYLREVAEWCKELNVFVTLEHIQPNAHTGWSIQSAWNFAKQIGVLESLFPKALLVRPQTWQATLWTGEKLKDAKAKSLRAAQIYWPAMDWRKSERAKIPHDGMVDAALIARYGLGCYNQTKQTS